MNKSTIYSQSSIIKPRKGLSLSLEKHNSKINYTHNLNSNILTKNYIQSSTNQQENNQNCIFSNKKNRIKFVEGYQNRNQSGSKFKNNKFFKIVDQDIKLGGTKKSSLHSNQQRLSFNMSTNKKIELINKSGEQSIGQFYKLIIPGTIQKKSIRQPKFNKSNLKQNLQYFQFININKRQPCLLQFQNNYHHAKRNNLSQQLKQPFSQNNINILNPLQDNSNTKFDMYTYQLQKLAQKCQPSKQSRNPGIIMPNNLQDNYIQRINTSQHKLKKSTVEKLEQVQSRLDQLIRQANEAKETIKKC